MWKRVLNQFCFLSGREEEIVLVVVGVVVEEGGGRGWSERSVNGGMPGQPRREKWLRRIWEECSGTVLGGGGGAYLSEV